MNKTWMKKTAASILEINREFFPWFLALYLIVLVLNQISAVSNLINFSPNYLFGVCIVSGILFIIKKSSSQEIEHIKLDFFFVLPLVLLFTLLIFLVLPGDNQLNLRVAFLNLAVSLIFFFIISSKSG